MEKNSKPTLWGNLQGFHEDEDGIEAVQVVLILALALVALVVMWKQWPKIKQFFEKGSQKTLEAEKDLN